MPILKIYLADLHAYNNGTLRGGWIDVEGKSADEILEEAEEKGFLGRNPYAPEERNEWAIHDHEGFGEGMIGEYTSLDTIIQLSEQAEDMTDEGWEAFCNYAENVGGTQEAFNMFDDAYCGKYDTMKDYAEQFFDDVYLHDVPEHIRCYVDYERFTHDLECDGYWISNNGHVFQPV